eukprot:7740645-Lingulodinium_polyedra.AAC.1
MEVGGGACEDADRGPGPGPQEGGVDRASHAGAAKEGGGIVLAYKSEGLRPLQVPTVPRRHLGSYVVEE